MGESTETMHEVAAAKRQNAIAGVVDASSDAAREGADGLLVVGDVDKADSTPKGRRSSKPTETA